MNANAHSLFGPMTLEKLVVRCFCNFLTTTVNHEQIETVRTRIYLGPVYMEKSCPGQEGHPPSRVNLSERLYEKKVDPFARAKR